jgi:WD40 repeat protein
VIRVRRLNPSWIVCLAVLIAAIPRLVTSQGRLEVTPGRVVVVTDVAALVQLDQQPAVKVGPSGQVTFDVVAPGMHHVKITAPGKIDLERNITVDPAQTRRVEAPLADVVAALEILTTPGADVYVDGVRKGTADSKGVLRVTGIATGNRRISAVKAGFQRRDTIATLRSELVVSVSLELMPVAVAPPVARAAAPSFSLVRTVSELAEAVAVSPDGKWFATCQSTTDHLATWDATTGRARAEVKLEGSDKYCDTALTADTQHVVLGWGEFAFVFDAATGNEVRRLELPRPRNREFKPEARGVAVDPSGRQLAAADFIDGSVTMFDLASGARLWSAAGLPPAETNRQVVLSLAFNDAGDRVAVAGKHFLEILDSATGKVLQSLSQAQSTSTNGIATARWAPNGAWVVSGSETIQLWDMATGKPGYAWSAMPGPCAGFSPDSRFVLMHNDKRRHLDLIDVATGAVVSEVSSPIGAIQACAITADWRVLVTTTPWDNGFVQIWQRK